MSEATASQEPSMEEILASIRRIISEEGQEQPGGDALAPLAIPSDSPPVQATPPAPKPQPPVQAQAPKVVPPATPMLVEDDDEDDLVLTEVVTSTADLGQNNVVPLKPEAKFDMAAEPQLAEPDMADDEIELALDEPMMSEPLPEKVPAGSKVDPMDIDDFMADEPKKAEKPAPKARGWAEPEGTPAPKIEADEFAQMTEELPDLVAPEVASAATASFAQLLQPSRKATDAVERPAGDGLLVETLVRMAVEPMLKAWLDANLEPIVERIVRREVERMARKAELG